jgi:flavin reductase ActVB
MLPPTIAVSLSDSTVSVRTIQQQGTFGVSILGERLIEAAQFGSIRGAPKFVDGFCAEDGRESTTPALKAAIAHVDCRLVRAVPVADHVVLFGEVERVLRSPEEDRPLVYHDRRYHRLSFASDIQAAPAPDLWW